MISRTTTPPRRLVAATLVLLLGPALWAPSEGRAEPAPQPSSPPPSGADAPARPARRGGGGRRLAPVRPPTLEQSMRSRLAHGPFRGARVGAEIVSLRDGQTLFGQSATLPLVPASTMKVLTGAAILDRLGPDWRYETKLLAARAPANGVIEGDLYVEAAGAPDLVVERFPEFAQALSAAGVREVRGDVVADLSYFDGENRPPDWALGNAPNPFTAPISALAANFSTVRVTVSPGPKPGAPASILVEPPADAVPVSGKVRTTQIGLQVRATRVLEKGADGEVANRIVVSGRIAVTAPPWERFVPIENPAIVAVSAVKRALENGGISVRGVARTGEIPAGAVAVAAVHSKPLSEIVLSMNKHSQNFIAEMLQRTLGAEAFGPPGTRQKGARAVLGFLRTCGVDTAGVNLYDGSGLSHSNQLTADALVRVLVRVRGDPRLEAAFVDSLPVGGVDGTLQSRMTGIARGRVRAKTGHVDGVTALAGYIDDASEGPIAFAFLVNGASHPRAVAGLDDVCRILCTPRGESLEPASTR